MIPHDELIITLQSLVEICRDGNQGFKDAGDGVKDPKLRDLLHYYSEQRMNFSLELGRLVDKHFGDTNLTGTILGSLHRRWMDIRFGIIGSSTKGILTECLRGENAANKKYEEALARDLPADVKKVLEYQHGEVKKVIENLTRLAELNGLNVAAEENQ
jgi:uncharacterized protein (TIGR02284 family)